jgi:hypothetical protein
VNACDRWGLVRRWCLLPFGACACGELAPLKCVWQARQDLGNGLLTDPENYARGGGDRVFYCLRRCLHSTRLAKWCWRAHNVL